MNGDVQEARRLMGEIADREIVAWYDEFAQNVEDVHYELLNQRSAFGKYDYALKVLCLQLPSTECRITG